MELTIPVKIDTTNALPQLEKLSAAFSASVKQFTEAFTQMTKATAGFTSAVEKADKGGQQAARAANAIFLTMAQLRRAAQQINPETASFGQFYGSLGEAATRTPLAKPRELPEADKKKIKDMLDNRTFWADRDKKAEEFYSKEIDKAWNLTDAEKFQQKTGEGYKTEGANPNRLTDQFVAAIVKLQNVWGSFEQQIANGFTTVMSGAADSLSTAMKGLILGTKDWNSALKEISNSILSNIAGAISKMAAQWITNVALMGAKWIATRLGISAVEIAADTKETAAKTPKALLESISSWGGAALLGVAAFTAAMALAGGFADGGYTGNGGRLEPAGMVHRGEWVMPQSTVNAWGHANMAAIQAGPRALGGSATSAAPPNIKVIMVADMKAASLEALKTPAGEQLIVQAVNGKRFQLGLGT